MNPLLELAGRVDTLARKIEGAIDNREHLSAGSQAIVIAMLVTLELNLFNEVAAALRSRAALGTGGAK